MRARPASLSPAAALSGIWGLLLLASVVAVLYFGRPVLVPIALAALITFLLSRLVTRLERWIGRIAAVLVTVIATVAVCAGMGWVIGRQVIDLAEKLPDYQANITAKIRSLKLPAGGPLARFSSSVHALQDELIAASPALPPEQGSGAVPPKNASHPTTPVPVRVIEGRSAIPQLMQDTISAVLSPLGTAALVLLLVIFMLLKREDIRGRLIRLVGQGSISTTTRAMEDAGRRVSRYLITQFLVNTCYGICVATGLHFIGIPNAALWGLLAGVFRFVPYVGPWVGALLPILLSFAISTNWFTPLMTFGLFIGLETIVSNFIEPWVYGANTGVSPIALIVSAVFWTWLWGPVGLLLSTPLTVCLAVMGRHIPRLEFLGILLSEDQPLAPHEEFYHRMLSFSTDSAHDFATKYAETESVVALYDSVLIPAIAAVEVDADHGTLTAEQRTSALQRVHEIIDDLGEWEFSPGDRDEAKASDNVAGSIPVTGSRVVCLPASAYRDELAGDMLSQLLRNHGFEAENLPARLNHQELIERAVKLRPETVCVSVLPPTSITQARHLITAIRDQLGNVGILVGVWNATFDSKKLREHWRPAHAAEVAVSLADAVHRLSKMTAAITDEMLPAPVPANEEDRLAELKGLNLLNDTAEPEFDHITERLTKLFRVPMAVLSLIDENRQWFKSQTGLPGDLAAAGCTPREVSICGHVVANDEILIVRDLARDPRFANNSFVKEHGLRFYAGVPLRGPNGFPIGSLCILDTKPREMTPQEEHLLKMIAEDVMEQIKRRPVATTPSMPATEKA